MSIRAKRTIITAALLLSIVWNLLCLLALVPVKQYVYSLMSVGVISFIIVFKNLFFPFAIDEKSAYIKELTQIEKVWAGISALLAVIWIGTTIACMI